MLNLSFYKNEIRFLPNGVYLPSFRQLHSGGIPLSSACLVCWDMVWTCGFQIYPHSNPLPLRPSY